MHEHIFAAIVTLDETESLHVVEEFNSAVGAFAGRFAHRATLEPGITITAATLEATTVTAAVTIKTAAFGTRGALGNGDRITVDDKVGCRYLAATIHQREFERLTFGQSGQASLFDRTDMDKDIIRTVIDLNEAKTLLTVEKLDDSFARTDHLSGHCRATRGSAEATAAACSTAAEAAATATAGATKAAAGALTSSQFAGE